MKNKNKRSILSKKIALMLGISLGLGALSTSNVDATALASNANKINVLSDFNDPNKPMFSGNTNSNAYDLYRAQALLNIELAAEGIAVMENKNNFLPMNNNQNHGNKISIFGKQATKYTYAPVGAGDASNYNIMSNGSTQSGWLDNEEVTLYDAFRGTDTQAHNSSGVTASYAYFYDALSQSFEINPELVDFYEDDDRSPYTHVKHGTGGGHFGHYKAGMPIAEVGADHFKADSGKVMDSFKDYNDAAIVVLNRLSGEGSDVPKTMLQSKEDGSEAEWSGKAPGSDFYSDANKMSGARHWDDHYLQLDADEVSMLQMVMDNFDNVIILLNTNTQLEIGFMNDPGHYLFSDNDYATTEQEKVEAMDKLKSAIYCSYPGTFGAAAIPKIIDGSINPSGKLADTWMRDFKLDPVWQNQGYGEVASGCATNGSYANSWVQNFVHYDEDIYLGYRYFETRYVEDGNGEEPLTTSGDTSKNNGSITDQSFSSSTTEWSSWYDSAVLYPFGHGLSYTTFDWSNISITGNLTEKGTIKAKVTVTNTGTVAGKEVVQLYYTTPYYDGQIQKSHVELGGFGKTELLAPGASQILTIEMPVEYMKSYDWSDANNNGIKGYEMDAGDYYITLAKDAHDAAQKTYTKDTVTTQKFKLENNIHFKYDLTTGTEVVNVFDYASGTGFTNEVSKENPFKGVEQYMMRNDFQATWPTHNASYKKINYQNLGINQVMADASIAAQGDEGQAWEIDENISYPNQATVSGTSYTNKIKLWHMTGRDYDDPLWEAFLDQLTPEEMANFIGVCNYQSLAIDSIDKPFNKDNDGALGAKQTVSIQWPANPIVAGTFNTELSELHGRLFANSAHFQKDGNAPGGIYGTGLETHRSPFAGRNAEYYSECPILSGLMCAEFAIGSYDVGVFVTIKHMGLNNCDTQRGSISTWASEQAIREIHTKGYEIVVKTGATTAIMSATNLVGDQSAATCYPLLTSLLRDEWGYEGFVLSDMTARDPELCMRAGNDLQLQGSANIPAYDREAVEALGYDYDTNLHYLRLATKRLMYVFSNTQIMNTYGGDSLDNMIYSGSTQLQAIAGISTELNINNVQTIYNDHNGIKFELAEGSSLPAGLTLKEDGTIIGTSTANPGAYKFTVNMKENIAEANIASDKTSDETRYEGSNKLDTVAFAYKDIQQTFTIIIIPEDTVKTNTMYYTSSQLTSAATGYSYSQNVASAFYYDSNKQRHEDIEYSLAGGTLPSGLTFNSSTGTIEGTCTAASGIYKLSITAKAKNASHNVADLTSDFIIEVKQYGIEYNSKELTDLNVGDNAADSNISVATATNNSGYEITYSLKEGSTLPKGLSLTSNGQIIGTATGGSIDHEFVVVASSRETADVETTFKISVHGFYANNQVFENLVYGKKYNIQIVIGHTEGLDVTGTYSLKEGSVLPRGLSLTEDGRLEGTVYFLDNTTLTIICSTEYGDYEMVINLLPIDLETEDVYGDVAEPFDVEAYNKSQTTTTVIITCIALVSIVAIVGGSVFFVFNKRTF